MEINDKRYLSAILSIDENYKNIRVQVGLFHLSLQIQKSTKIDTSILITLN